MVIELTERITCKRIVIDWLKQHPNTIITHHFLDQELPEYGKEEFGVYYSPSTFHRVFCWIKKEPETLKEENIELEQLVEGSGKVNKWRIKSLENGEEKRINN
jgi:hypothetical protein